MEKRFYCPICGHHYTRKEYGLKDGLIHFHCTNCEYDCDEHEVICGIEDGLNDGLEDYDLSKIEITEQDHIKFNEQSKNFAEKMLEIKAQLKPIHEQMIAAIFDMVNLMGGKIEFEEYFPEPEDEFIIINKEGWGYTNVETILSVEVNNEENEVYFNTNVSSECVLDKDDDFLERLYERIYNIFEEEN